MTREEAINKVRQMSLPKETMEILEALAPELAESEDERMLREIKRYIKEQGNKPTGLPNGTVAVADMIAWLEKQKECVSNNFDDVWDEEDCEEIIAEGQKLTPRFKELLKEVCHAWYDRGAKLEKLEDASKAIEAVDRIDKYIDEHLANAHDMKDSNPDKKYYRGWDDALGKMAGILQDVYSDEKQKEQKHPNGCFTCDEYKKGYEEGRRNGFTAGYNKAMKEVEQKEQKPSGETNVEPDSKIPREEYLYHLLANHIITFTDYTYLLEKKPFDYECANIPQKDYIPVEQKPADLSEMMVHKEPCIAPVPTPIVADEQKQDWSEEDKQNLSVCLTYIKDTQLRDWLIEAFHKSSEWSDEDEKILKLLILNIGRYKYFGGMSSERILAFLKSLRPQYHGDVTMTEAYKMGKEAGEASRWKPNEHQMNILKAVKDYVGKGSGYWGEGLGSLITDLEKLI